jgi:hypothetical protein
VDNSVDREAWKKGLQTMLFIGSNTVEPGYNDIGLYGISPLELDIL